MTNCSQNKYWLGKVLLCISLSLFLFAQASGQPYYFKHYQVENGLSNNTVNYIRQDSKGFIWIATKDGLNRFDGSRFKVFRLNTDLKTKDFKKDYIFCLLPGKDGALWVGAENGLYKFNPKKEKLEIFIDSLRNIYELTLDPQGRMWFLSYNTLYRYNFKTRSLKKFPVSDYFAATSICLSESGHIWIATDNGYLKKYEELTNTFSSYDVFAHSKTTSTRFIQKIKAGENDSLFIGTAAQGLKLFDTRSFKYRDVLTLNPDKTTIFVRDILRNNENEYWIATESGIFIYHTTTNSFTNLKKKFRDPYSLNDNAIYTLFKDSEGSIWVGTFFGGINYYAKRNGAFIKYFPDNSGNSIGGSSIREITKDKYNNLWIGSEDGGLSKINNKNSTIKVFEPTGSKASIAYPNIHGLLAEGDDLWIGTFEHGIDIMDIRTGKIKKHFSAGSGKKDIKSNFALCFMRTTTGTIYIGTGNGVFYFDKLNQAFKRPAGIPENLFITSLLEDHRNIIWASTNDNGVFWFDPLTNQNGNFRNIQNYYNTLSNNSVNDVHEDTSHNLWFATEGGGLSKLDPSRKRFTIFNNTNGLSSNIVYKILGDNNNRLWASTSKGLNNFDIDFKKVTIYTKANGLLSDQFNYHSGYEDEEGRLYFGSVKGMVSFMPEQLVKSDFKAPIYLTGFQVFNEEIDPTVDTSIITESIIDEGNIILPYNQSSISFDFAALSYVSPEMTYYKFRLEGAEKKWTTINSNRKVYFTNLSPGKYTFNVQASTNGEWDSKIKTVGIDITPPWWDTWWAWMLYVSTVLSLFYYLFSYYKKWLHEKKIKEIYEAKINFFTNVAHEIKTPLTLIKGPVENLLEIKDELPGIKEDVECLDRNTNRLMDLVSQIFDLRETETNNFKLRFKRVNLSELLRETSLRFTIFAKKRNLHYELFLPGGDIYIKADNEALQKILSNLFSNAIKYADTKVDIKLNNIQKNEKGEEFTIVEFENDGYIITPEDEQKIFEPFYRIKETAHKKGTGLGLSISKSLTELHKGSLSLKFNKKGINVFYLTLVTEPKIA